MDSIGYCNMLRFLRTNKTTWQLLLCFAMSLVRFERLCQFSVIWWSWFWLIWLIHPILGHRPSTTFSDNFGLVFPPSISIFWGFCHICVFRLIFSLTLRVPLECLYCYLLPWLSDGVVHPAPFRCTKCWQTWNILEKSDGSWLQQISHFTVPSGGFFIDSFLSWGHSCFICQAFKSVLFESFRPNITIY